MAELVLESTDSDMLDLNDFISYQWAPVCPLDIHD